MEEKVEVIQGVNLDIISQSEIDMQVKMAKAYPRDMVQVKEVIIEIACSSKGVAGKCFYELPAPSGGDKKITGPSVRLGEIVNFSWGNSMSGGRIVEVTQRFVKAQGFFYDLEKNTRVYVEVTRSIITKEGNRFSESLINTTKMAAISIAIRNATFKAIPMAYLMDIEKRIKDTAIGDIKDLETARKAALDYFQEKHKATKDEVCKYLHVKSIESIGRDELWSLKKLQTALEEKQVKADEAFGRVKAKGEAGASKKLYDSAPGGNKKPSSKKK